MIEAIRFCYGTASIFLVTASKTETASKNETASKTESFYSKNEGKDAVFLI